MIRFYFLLTSALASLALCAQETATKVSDFNYGISGKSIITSVHAANNQLYANIFQFYGDDAAGLISTLDPENGSPTAVLDPQQTEWFGGETIADRPIVFEAGGMVFGYQRNLASGTDLYRLDGPEPVFLMSAIESNFSQPVVLGDSLYFLTSNLPYRQSAGQSGSLVAELWRTDGTAAGTQRVTSLLSFITSSGFLRMVAGETKLLIDIADGQDQVFYVYEPNGAGLALLGQGIGQFLLDTPLRPVENPLAYHNGGFYVYGAPRFENIAEVYRVDEETYEIEEVVLPVIPSDDFPFLQAEYDQIEFLNFKDSLYFFAGRSEGENGNDFYRIGGADGLTVTEILASPEINFTILEEYYTPAVVEDTLYYLSRRGTDSVTLYAYEQSLQAPVELVNVFFGNSSALLSANDRFVYITLRNENRLIRFDKSTGAVVSVEFNFRGFGSSNITTVLNPLAILDEGAYFVSNKTGKGLEFLATNADTLISIGNFINTNSNLNPWIFGKSSSPEGLTMFNGNHILYNQDEDSFEEVSFAPSLAPIILNVFFETEAETYYSVFDSNFFYRRLVKFKDLIYQELPLITTEEFDAATYSLRPLSSDNVGDERKIVNFDPGAGSLVGPHLVIAEIVDDSLKLTDFLPEGVDNNGSLYFSNNEYYALDTRNETDNEIVVYDYSATEIFRFSIPLTAIVRAITSEGVFVEDIDELTFLSTMSFYPLDGSAPVDMPFNSGTNAYANRDFIPLNGRLLFIGDDPAKGRELFVADPALGMVSILKDINPGRGIGVFDAEPNLVTENGLFFRANDGSNGNELWYTDGTEEGTMMLADINPGINSSNPREFTLIDSTVFFSANGPAGYELYRLHLRDNTPELIVDLNVGEGDAHPYSFTRLGDIFYFFGRESEGSTYELYKLSYSVVPTEATPVAIPAKVYPNPVGNLPLTIEAPTGETLQRVQLFSTTGQLLKEVNADSERTSLDLSGLPAGQYWLRSWYASGRFSLNAVQRVK